MKLSDWRKSKGWSQPYLASELGCSLASVARYEGGTRRPDDATMQKIFVVTDGQVQPNDFYPIDRWRLLLRTVSSFFQRDAA